MLKLKSNGELGIVAVDFARVLGGVSDGVIAAVGSVGKSGAKLKVANGSLQTKGQRTHLFLTILHVNFIAYLSMEIEPNSVQCTSGVIALKVRNGTELLDKGLGELFGLVLVARDNVVAFKSLVDIELVVEVNGHAEEISHFLSGGVVAVAGGVESREAGTVLAPFCLEIRTYLSKCPLILESLRNQSSKIHTVSPE